MTRTHAEVEQVKKADEQHVGKHVHRAGEAPEIGLLVEPPAVADGPALARDHDVYENQRGEIEHELERESVGPVHSELELSLGVRPPVVAVLRLLPLTAIPAVPAAVVVPAALLPAVVVSAVPPVGVPDLPAVAEERRGPYQQDH